MNDENFAYRVRHALNEKLEDLPEHTTDKLRRARLLAVSRKKKESPLFIQVFEQALAGVSQHVFPGGMSWMAKLGMVLSVLVVAIGLASMFHYERQRQIREIADIDIAVLSDELPPSAYADSGFKAFVADRSRTGV